MLLIKHVVYATLLQLPRTKTIFLTFSEVAAELSAAGPSISGFILNKAGWVSMHPASPLHLFFLMPQITY